MADFATTDFAIDAKLLRQLLEAKFPGLFADVSRFKSTVTVPARVNFAAA